MSWRDEFRKAAADIAAGAQTRARTVQKEIHELAARQNQLDAELEILIGAQDRLAGYNPGDVGDVRCPRCWVRDGQHSSMRPIPGTEREDLFRCAVCQLTLSTPA